jgi:hypothetical protein
MIISGCQKCDNKTGIIIEDINGKFCIRCHPTAISNMLSPEENLNKLKDLDFKNVRETIYEKD